MDSHGLPSGLLRVRFWVAAAGASSGCAPTRPSTGTALPFCDLSPSFHCLSLTVSITFHCCPLIFHCRFPCPSLTAHRLFLRLQVSATKELIWDLRRDRRHGASLSRVAALRSVAIPIAACRPHPAREQAEIRAISTPLGALHITTSCDMTTVPVPRPTDLGVSHGLQLQSRWRIATAAVGLTRVRSCQGLVISVVGARIGAGLSEVPKCTQTPRCCDAIALWSFALSIIIGTHSRSRVFCARSFQASSGCGSTSSSARRQCARRRSARRGRRRTSSSRSSTWCARSSRVAALRSVAIPIAAC